MNAITVCVNYDDLLALTLPRMLEHFERVTVVTDPGDVGTLETVAACGGELFITDAFYRDGAVFNKGAALDEALFFASGWLCVLDSDIYLPRQMDLQVHRGFLYSPHRRLMDEPGEMPPESEWKQFKPGPEYRSNEFAGYFHLFHMDDAGDGPWYESEQWKTAQGCDSMFTRRWNKPMLRMPFEVLHLGTPVVNWHGRMSPRWG